MASQSMSGKANYNTDPNHIYYDLQLLNNDTVGSSQSLPVRFSETRTSTILANPSEYFLSIQRFSLDTPSLPLFLPEPETNVAFNPTLDPNQLVYRFAIYQQGSATPPISFPVTFVPDFNPTVPKPTTLDLNALSDPYYFVYQFRDFIDMMNVAIANECDTLGIPAPFFDIDLSNNMALYFPQNSTPNTYNPDGSIKTSGSVGNIWDDSIINGPINSSWVLCMNSPLWALLSSFQTRYIDSLNYLAGPGAFFTPTTNPLEINGWYVFKVTPALVGATVNPIDVSSINLTGGYQSFGHQYYTVSTNQFPWLSDRYTQSTPDTLSFTVQVSAYPCTPIWNPVRQLLFTTALMPITNELVATPAVFNSNLALDNDDANNNFSPIITDLEVPLTRGDETKPTVNYSPQAEYRLIDLQSNSPINAIEISIFWKDAYGGIHPFLLEPGCSASLKLLFRKKIYNLIHLPEYTKPPNS
jgi:hypothetical protein